MWLLLCNALLTPIFSATDQDGNGVINRDDLVGLLSHLPIKQMLQAQSTVNHVCVFFSVVVGGMLSFYAWLLK